MLCVIKEDVKFVWPFSKTTSTKRNSGCQDLVEDNRITQPESDDNDIIYIFPACF